MKKEYKSYKELNENSVGEWAAQLDVAGRRELTEKEAELFLKSSFIEERIEEAKNDGFKELLDGWNGLNLIYRRLQLHSFSMSKAAMLWCGILVSSPGEAVMMVNYMQYRCHLFHINYVDMKELGTRIMPNGWFSKDVLQDFWERQKYVTETGILANMLDNPEFGTSISVQD